MCPYRYRLVRYMLENCKHLEDPHSKDYDVLWLADFFNHFAEVDIGQK